MSPTAATIIAGVAGAPIAHSLSPTLHNAWIAAAGLDAVYLAFEPADFPAFARGMKGGAVRGLNVTAPFKAKAMEVADRVTARVERAGAANLLLFEKDGAILADNTDGMGLLAALRSQAEAFDPAAGPALILGAGGAARGAVAALVEAGAPEIRVANRSRDRAQALARCFAETVRAVDPTAVDQALGEVTLIINATSADPGLSFAPAPASTLVMDMVYRPLTTPFLSRAAKRGLKVVDGLEMLIGQARPSYQALFGEPPPDVDVRAIALRALEGER